VEIIEGWVPPIKQECKKEVIAKEIDKDRLLIPFGRTDVMPIVEVDKRKRESEEVDGSLEAKRHRYSPNVVSHRRNK
jgi:hypothetical protein|tara:strand:- start:440 stop:670 length:231 start_codon:yes stop_codon:yes gene_type:complete